MQSTRAPHQKLPCSDTLIDSEGTDSTITVDLFMRARGWVLSTIILVILKEAFSWGSDG